VHNGFVRVDNEKMSKSLGNFFTIREVLDKYKAEVVRFFLIRTHYRTALNYSDVHLDDANQALNRLYTALKLVAPQDVSIDWTEPYAARFKAAMDEDFGTPEAVAVLFDLAGEVNRTHSAHLSGVLKALGACLGLLQQDPGTYFQMRVGAVNHASPLGATASDNTFGPAEIEGLIAERAQAKAAKNFGEADRIRQSLHARGIVLKYPGGDNDWCYPDANGIPDTSGVRRGNRSSGVTCAHQRVRSARLYQIHATADGGVLLFSHGFRRAIAHFNDLRGGDHFNSGVREGESLQFSFDALRIADEVKARNFSVFAKR
jgi:hypothetical protein